MKMGGRVDIVPQGESHMDFRVSLHVPKRFAYVLRMAGANLCHREFDLACALSFASLRHISLVGHTDYPITRQQ